MRRPWRHTGVRAAGATSSRGPRERRWRCRPMKIEPCVENSLPEDSAGGGGGTGFWGWPRNGATAVGPVLAAPSWEDPTSTLLLSPTAWFRSTSSGLPRGARREEGGSCTGGPRSASARVDFGPPQAADPMASGLLREDDMPDEATIRTRLGQIRVVWDGGTLTQLLLESPPRSPGTSLPAQVVEGPAPNSEGAALLADLVGYFSGGGVTPGRGVSLPAGTLFQREVWAAAREIPLGQTRTYGSIAGLVGRPGAARAAGAALGRNPCPIVVPCHRVVGASGDLTGFAFGTEWKARLLELEGVKIGDCRSRLARG